MDIDSERTRDFFARVCAEFPCVGRPVSIIVTHLLPDRPFFIEALARQTDVGLILAKPKSIHHATKKLLSARFPTEIARGRFVDGPSMVRLLARRCGGRPAILLDIGGYFADVASFAAANYDGGILAIVEDTENGLRRYERQERLSCPVISVARSPLKAAEDFLVGQSIVHSVEALLRGQGDILHGRTACVIGYGKLGRSIANLLHARHVRTAVFDIDPIRSVEAMSHGFSVADRLESALRGAGLVFCATGNMSLLRADFASLDDGAYIATVTSSDDELALDLIDGDYVQERVADHITRFRKNGRHFYLLNHGQAVNFIHGAAVGPFIYLVQAEILVSAARSSAAPLAAGLSENDAPLRRRIAEAWLDCFGPRAARGPHDQN